jgi:hypothetical protein
MVATVNQPEVTLAAAAVELEKPEELMERVMVVTGLFIQLLDRQLPTQVAAVVAGTEPR